MAVKTIDHQKLQHACVLILFIVISAVFLRMIWGLALAVVLAAIFAGLTYGTYSRLLRLFKGRKSAASAVSVVLVILLIVTPLVFIGAMVTSQAVSISESLTPWIQQHLSGLDTAGSPLERLPFWDRLEPYREQVTTKLGEIAEAVSSFLMGSLSAVTKGTVDFFFKLFIMLYSMFFFLMFGQELLDNVMRLFPLSNEHKGLLLDKFVSVSRATLKGTLVIGIVQGGLAGLAFWAVGIKGAAFWGTVMAVLSIIPGIGTALVWVPAVFYLLAVGRVVPAIGLLVWCAIVVGMADNVLRPSLVGKDTEMPDLLVMLSTFGGLAMFGAVGLVLGPLVAALFLAIWRIYAETFGDMLTGPEPAEAEQAVGEA